MDISFEDKIWAMLRAYANILFSESEGKDELLREMYCSSLSPFLNSLMHLQKNNDNMLSEYIYQGKNSDDSFSFLILSLYEPIAEHKLCFLFKAIFFYQSSHSILLNNMAIEILNEIFRTFDDSNLEVFYQFCLKEAKQMVKFNFIDYEVELIEILIKNYRKGWRLVADALEYDPKADVCESKICWSIKSLEEIEDFRSAIKLINQLKSKLLYFYSGKLLSYSICFAYQYSVQLINDNNYKEYVDWIKKNLAKIKSILGNNCHAESLFKLWFIQGLAYTEIVNAFKPSTEMFNTCKLLVKLGCLSSFWLIYIMIIYTDLKKNLHFSGDFKILFQDMRKYLELIYAYIRIQTPLQMVRVTHEEIKNLMWIYANMFYKGIFVKKSIPFALEVVETTINFFKSALNYHIFEEFKSEGDFLVSSLLIKIKLKSNKLDEQKFNEFVECFKKNFGNSKTACYFMIRLLSMSHHNIEHIKNLVQFDILTSDETENIPPLIATHCFAIKGLGYLSNKKNSEHILLNSQGNGKRCVSCDIHPRTVFALPCKHLLICNLCIRPNMICDVCNEPVLKTLKVYN